METTSTSTAAAAAAAAGDQPSSSITAGVDRHPLTGALLRAAYDGDIERVTTLLREGVPVDSSNSAGLQALHFAAKAGHLDVAKHLLDSGATINAASSKGHTSLHVAALLGQPEIVKLLLRRGADVNAQSQCFEDMFTPLYMAAQIGQQEIVTLLLAHGADPTIPTKNGSTPRDIASQQGFRPLAELLSEYERRLTNGTTGSTSSDDQSVLGESTGCGTISGDSGSIGGSPSRTGTNRLRVVRPRPPAVYNRDVIPSPRNSPMKSGAPLDQYLRTSTTGSKPNATGST